MAPERLESRAVLATFAVTTLADSGPGSLRAAISQANSRPGLDDVAFAVAGTIALRSALPAVSDPVVIAGGTAPGFISAPRVTINFAGRNGLRFAAGSAGSRLESLALVRAAGHGVTLEASGITVVGNYVGVLPDGVTRAGNGGDGIRVVAGSSSNLIGLNTEIDYSLTPSVPAAAGGTLPVEGWQGLTTAGTAGQYIFTGSTRNPADSSESAGLVYVGPISGEGGDGYAMTMPDQGTAVTSGTTSYSADLLGGGEMRIVGTYTNSGASNQLGFLFTGSVDDVADPAAYAPLPMPAGASWNVPHSTSGGLVVGNYDSSTANGLPAGGGRAYVYDAVGGRFLVPSMVYPGSVSNTAYGIWWNGGTSYTICGGYANSPVNNLLEPHRPLSRALLVDFDSATQTFSNWKSFSYGPSTGAVASITHFEGISGVEAGSYTLAATALVGDDAVAGFVRVYRNPDGSFGEMQWTDLEPPVIDGAAFGDSVYGDAVVGIAPVGSTMNAYQATVTRLGNLIGGNKGNGVTLAGTDTVVAGNAIGVNVTGAAALANGGDGVRILQSGSGNLIGDRDPVTEIAYADADAVSVPVTGWQGLRAASDAGEYLFAGTSGDSGLIVVGPLSAVGGTPYVFDYPGASQTSAYGPDLLSDDDVRVVGSYVEDGASTRYGFLYEGNLSDFGTAANYRTIRPASNPEFTYAHSSMGGLVVGNYDSATANGQPIGPGKAFLYDVASDTFLDDVSFPGAASTTAYGIWDNGDGSFTICGGYSLDPINNLASDASQLVPIGLGFLVDFDSRSGGYLNWQSFSYPTARLDVTAVTHFEGISSVEKGVYTLAASSARVGASTGEVGSFVTVLRNTDGSFGQATWRDITYPGAMASLTTSVYGNAVTGIAVSDTGTTSYQASIDTGFQLSNVIAGNTGNGVTITGGKGNQLAMNHVGTSFAGIAAVPNGGHGVLLTGRAADNLIGGQANTGNAPTGNTFVRPPLGNLISGNRANGVLVNDGATGNTLSGNFIGTAASGNAALGNGADGVAIVNANGNGLIGTTFRQSPFVFYNVLSGNVGNGLRVTNANDTIVQANFAGLGADNATVVANGGDGILVNGTSTNTVVGGPIPLGNVFSGNNRHGIEIAGKARGLVSFNSFVGMVAFGGAAPNRLNGIQVTATGGENVIRTCLVAGNYGNGIVLAGEATGVTIEDTACGTNSAISTALPNYGSGVLITDDAHDNQIGGYQVSIETKVHLSGNLRYGLEITGRARNNRVYNTVVGAGFFAPFEAIPNSLGGIFIGPGTSATTLGGTQPFMALRVMYNGGDGVTIDGSTGNRIVGSEIRGNAGNGISLSGGRNNALGIPGAGNAVVENKLNGIQVWGDVRGSTIEASGLLHNAANGLLLNAATGLSVGGPLDSQSNTVVTSGLYGLQAVGTCSGTKVVRNLFRSNSSGNVEISGATGIVYIP